MKTDYRCDTMKPQFNDNVKDLSVDSQKFLIQYLDELRELGYDHIAHKLEILWGSEECEKYLSDLMISDRMCRSGFPERVWKILMKFYVSDQTMKMKCIYI